MVEVRLGKLVGKAGEGKWVQVHDFLPGDEEKLLKRGRLVAVITEEEGMEAGREALARLHEAYYGDLERGILEQLKDAVDVVRQEFEGVETVATVIAGEKVHIVNGGNGGVWARVGEKEGWIVKKTTTGLVGKATDGEILVLGNGKFWESVPVEMVKASLGEMEETIEKLGGMVAGGEGAGGVVIKLKVSKGLDTLEPEFGEARAMGTKFSETPRVGDQKVERVERKEKVDWFKKIKEKWPKYELRVQYQDKDKMRKKLIWIGVGALLVLIGVAVGGQMWRKRAERLNDVNVQKVEELKVKFDEAKAMVSLNIVRARQLLEEITPEVQRLREAGMKDQRLVDIENELEKVKEGAMGIKRPAGEEIVDLGLVREGMSGERFVLSEGKLVVLDISGGRLVRVDPEKKNAEVIAGKEQIGEGRLVAAYPGKTTVFSDKGIVECPTGSAECLVKIKKDDEWKDVGDMEVWAGNIYLLDGGAHEVWVYRVGSDGYGAKQKWLAESQEVGKSMGIDGSIWGLKDNNILKFTRGVKEDFSVSGWDMALGEVIYTDDEAEKLYILNSQDGRVVAIKKTGEYDSQYVSDQIKGAKDLVVDEKGGKMYLLSGSKIWEIGL